MPTLTILVDGVQLSQLPGSVPDFGGFPVDQMLGMPTPAPQESGAWSDPAPGDDSPLLQGVEARRVALYLCSCGVAGCGVIAPIIATDGDTVTWSDFRGFTGVFDDPADPVDDAVGYGYAIDQIRFDARQYYSEVARALEDRSWESPSRVTARFLRAMLAEHEDVVDAAGFTLGWVVFAPWAKETGRFAIELRRANRRAAPGWEQYVVGLTAKFGTPTSRARSIVDRLLAVPVEDWYRRFPLDRG